ncbi:PIN domain-like protein [Bimuria novae-zelandiae CBS 107.79]|uniref:PIN domain-like protein n=1 Tax=Bimuria novae-zelandiae CBS 107.79 TaxID=1447943 RepID=A0A6A5UJY8_9PLEO|nr:PIN domain-like protein [Bimuria novae-zelandiae CBS 107.79]
MGVTGLWTVLQPNARPIKIETLNKKRLAVDASIWIYQFLKAVRDKEGNALRNSHIVGFFRRICKLLFIGIKPVFVFDGGAPALKRQTINHRKSRREGRREDAVRTAGKLLALQMQRVAEEEEKKRKEAARRPRDQREEPEEEIPDDLVYAEEVTQTQQERLANRKFKRKDQYHLPELSTSIAEMGGPNDPRMMSVEELQEYARQFDRGDQDINFYDFSTIDFDSPFFTSLPATDRYNILNAARIRSRLRMGLSKEQLEAMFPNRMDFSKFQIERARERNDLTQRLMNINGMSDESQFGTGMANRIAGDKEREYVLVKNNDVEGGWALGVVTNKNEGKREQPIDVDRVPVHNLDEDDGSEEDDDFEDVPIEGLNRLPKPPPGKTARDREGQEFISQELAKRRRKYYASKKARPAKPRAPRLPGPVAASEDPDSLFLASDDEQQEWEDVLIEDLDGQVAEPAGDDEEERQLQQAIALSMQQNGDEEEPESEEEDAYREVFHQERAQEPKPFAGTKGSGMAIARLANQRSSKVVPAGGPFNGSDSEDDDMDLQAALAESRKSKRPATAKLPVPKSPLRAAPPAPKPKSTNAPGFDGPLPFPKLNLGNSLLGKKKMEKLEADNAGGFEKDTGEKKNEAAPLPPWFRAGERNIEEEFRASREDEKKMWEQTRQEEAEQFQFQELPSLRKHNTQEVIDVDAEPSQEKPKEVLTVEDDEDEDDEMEDVVVVDEKLRVGDLADKVRAEPPQALRQDQPSPPKQDQPSPPKQDQPSPPKQDQPSPPKQDQKLVGKGPFAEVSDEPIEWSESEPEDERHRPAQQRAERAISEVPKEPPKSPSPEFEDIPMHTEPPTSVPAKSPSPEFEDVPLHAQATTEPPPAKSPSPEFEAVPTEPARRRREPSPFALQGAADLEVPVVPASGTADDNAPVDIPDDESDQYSDPEDADLFASLAAEGEEHARFAQELTNNSRPRIDFEEELKQLRAQQKKDRRDADEVTQTMVAECQTLLRLFGLPYVTAPMEAEAQCAELVRLGLVDGIVTDDSDTFLFGGTRVYKNMFNAAKFVECYLASDFESDNLTRERLIDMAQFLGSDYTTGIPGIGPIKAAELTKEFDSLEEFRAWWDAVQGGTIPVSAETSAFRKKFRKSHAHKLFLPVNFPDPRVKEAYFKPEVDSDPEQFQWGVPDLDALRSFLSSQIGWSAERTDEVLVPVIKDMARREKEGTQSNITMFFEGSVGAGAFAPRVRGEVGGGPSGQRKGRGAVGKRLGAALDTIAQKGKGNAADGDAAGDAEKADANGAASTNGGNKNKRKGRKAAAPAVVEEDTDGETDGENDEAYIEPPSKRTPRLPLRQSIRHYNQTPTPNMKIAITGAHGTVGKAVVKAAVETGHSIIQVDRTEPEPESGDKTDHHTADIANDYDATLKAFKGGDAVIHLAAIPNPVGKSDSLIHANNVNSAFNSFRACGELGIKKICYASSVNADGLAYANQPLKFKYFLIDEEYPPNPTDVYALAKIQTEMQAKAFANWFPGTKIACLRIHEVAPKKDVQEEHEENWGDAAVGRLWAWVSPKAAARACLLSVEKADAYEECEVFNIVAPETTQKTESRELAKRYYPNAQVRKGHEENKRFWTIEKAERVLGWKHEEKE